jgi:hypothetical protein
MDFAFYLFFVALFTGLSAWILFVWLLKEPREPKKPPPDDEPE